MAITNTGVTPVNISKHEAEKVIKSGVQATEFRVGVIVNKTTSMLEAVLESDDPSSNRYFISDG